MKTLLSILIFGLAALGAFAESSESDAQFFHPAASFYIQGDTTSASNLVVQGLALYPADGKLKRLKELLEKQQEQQQQDPKNENENQQENQEEPQEPDQPEAEPGEQEPQEQQPGEPESAEQMSEDEAKQLLDAMRQEEKNKRLQLHPVMGAPVKVDKDW